MKDSKLQSSMSFIVPPKEGDAVSAYLTAVNRALDAKTDASLARTIGVPPHVVANWRRRRRIPDDYVSWFSSTLVEKMGTYNEGVPNVGLTARAAVIALLTNTAGNPIDAKWNVSDANGVALGGLLALAQFLVDITHIHQLEDSDAASIAGLMKPLMRVMRHADHLRAYMGVPQ